MISDKNSKGITMRATFIKITKGIRKIEKYFLVAVVGMMVVFSFLQIILRAFFKALTWSDTLLNYSVLWSAMIAAGVITYESSHIKIDVIGRFARGRVKSLIYTLISFFGGLASILLALIFTVYVIVIEYFAKAGSSGATSYRWLFLSVLPFGFFIIAVRMLNRMIIYVHELFSRRILGLINASFAVLLPGLITGVLLFFMIYRQKYGAIISYFGDPQLFTMIIVVSVIVIFTGVAGIYNAVLWTKPRMTYYLSSAAGAYYLVLFIYVMLRLISLNIKSKVLNEMILFNDPAVNLLYIVPMVLFLCFHYSISYPAADYLVELYPRPDQDTEGGSI